MICTLCTGAMAQGIDSQVPQDNVQLNRDLIAHVWKGLLHV